MNIPNSILMICLGNICRSPIAEEVMRIKSQKNGLSIYVESCGLGSWHEGESADPRSCKIAKRYGYNIDNHRARQIRVDDFENFDLILVMDENNLKNAVQMRDQLIKSNQIQKSVDIKLLSHNDPTYKNQKVPDPYYGDMADFEEVTEKIESMVKSWLDIWDDENS